MQLPINTDRLVLRYFDESDTIALLDYRSEPEVARYQLWEPFTMSDAVKFIEEYRPLTDPVLGKWFGLAIVLKETGEMIGDLAFQINVDNTTAEIGFNLNPRFQGRGFALEAVKVLIN